MYFWQRPSSGTVVLSTALFSVRRYDDLALQYLLVYAAHDGTQTKEIIGSSFRWESKQSSFLRLTSIFQNALCMSSGNFRSILHTVHEFSDVPRGQTCRKIIG